MKEHAKKCHGQTLAVCFWKMDNPSLEGSASTTRSCEVCDWEYLCL